MTQGWIKLHRKMLNNKLYFSEPFSKMGAWIDLILIANHKPGIINVRGNLISIKRGQIGWSETSLGARWKWSRNKVRNFLKYLKTEQQIEQQKSKILSVITVLNYDLYQDKGTTDETTEGTTEGHQKVQQKDTNKKDKNKKNEKECKETSSKEEGQKPAETEKDLISFSEKKLEEKESSAKEKEKPSYGNQGINNMLIALKKKIGIDDFTDSQKWERIYGKHLISLINKIGTDEFVHRLENLLEDSFKQKNCNSIKFVYNQIKGYIEPKHPTGGLTLNR